MKLPERLKTQLTKNLVTALVALFAFFGAKVYHDISAPLLAHVLPAISNATLLSVCSLLALLVILLVWWVIYLHRAQRDSQEAKDKAFDDQFVEPMDPRGFWIHKTKSGFYCPNCKMRHAVSQLVDKKKLWRCPNHDCNHFVTNLEYKEPPPLPGRTLPRKWQV